MAIGVKIWVVTEVFEALLAADLTGTLPAWAKL